MTYKIYPFFSFKVTSIINLNKLSFSKYKFLYNSSSGVLPFLDLDSMNKVVLIFSFL